MVVFFPFLHIMSLPRPPLWTYRNLIHCYGSPYSVASDQGTHFTAREVPRWAMEMKSTGLTLLCTILRQLAQENNGVKVCLHGRLGQVLQKAVYTVSQHPIYATVSPTVRNRGVDKRVVPLAIAP